MVVCTFRMRFMCSLVQVGHFVSEGYSYIINLMVNVTEQCTKIEGNGHSRLMEHKK